MLNIFNPQHANKSCINLANADERPRRDARRPGRCRARGGVAGEAERVRARACDNHQNCALPPRDPTTDRRMRSYAFELPASWSSKVPKKAAPLLYTVKPQHTRHKYRRQLCARYLLHPMLRATAWGVRLIRRGVATAGARQRGGCAATRKPDQRGRWRDREHL